MASLLSLFFAESVLAAQPCGRERALLPLAIVQRGVPMLRGFSIDGFRAYAFRAHRWQQIAVQIDEKNQRGDFVLADGMPFTKDSDDRIFDENDELVLRGVDLGEPFGESDLTAALRAGGHHWRLDVCAGAKYLGTALLRHDPAAPVFSGPASVRFDAHDAAVETAKYRYIFRRDHPALLGQVFVREGGRESAVFSESSFRMPLHLPWWAPDFTWTPNDFRSEIESWQSGPIRSIVAVGTRMRNFLAMFNFHMFSELIFYEQHFQIPTVIEFNFDPSKYLLPGSGLGYALSFADNRDWHVDTNLVALPQQRVAASLDRLRASQYPHFFARGHSDNAAFYVKVRVDQQAAAQVPPPFLIRRAMFGSSAWSSEWKWLKDLQGDIGIFIDISGVRRGLYDFGLDLVLASKADGVAPSWFDPLHTTWTPPSKVE